MIEVSVLEFLDYISLLMQSGLNIFNGVKLVLSEKILATCFSQEITFFMQ
jgi:hypothetical protein